MIVTDIRYKSFLLLLFSFVASFAQMPSEALEKFLRTSGVERGSVAVKITDLSNGNIIISHNASAPLIPASIMKTVTIAALLNETGVNYRYHTPVYIDGPVDMGILRGNLVIEGSCDPSLHSRELPGSSDITMEIARALREHGVTKIEGSIVIDESGFAGPSRPDSWMSADFSQSYGTGSHAFNFDDNSTGRRSVENPKTLFMPRLMSSLSRNGISVDGNDLDHGKRKLIYDHVSAPVDEIMRSCMMRSDNLYAESMLRTYGKLTGGNGSTSESALTEVDMWRKKKMPMENVNIVDGSGLSRSNRVTADFMTAIVTSMSGNPDYASFFPLAGQEGTMSSFLSETTLDSYIAMKTGSMKGIQCYAGYLLDDDYVPTHTVVIIMNNITGSRDKVKKAAQNMLLDIFPRLNE